MTSAQIQGVIFATGNAGAFRSTAAPQDICWMPDNDPETTCASSFEAHSHGDDLARHEWHQVRRVDRKSPGSPKGVRESFEVIKPVLNHVVDLLSGQNKH